MEPSITITRCPYEEPYHLRLVIDASNGRVRGQLEFYTAADALTHLADALVVFPRHATDEYLWEQGSEVPEANFAFYFRLHVLVTDRSGHSAIWLRLNNNRELPDRELSEFCIRAESASLNCLGRLARTFANLEHEVLRWQPSEGRLYRTLADAQHAGITLGHE